MNNSREFSREHILDEVPTHIVYALNSGKFADALAKRDDEWFLRHASDSRLRKAAVHGILHAIETGSGEDNVRIRELLRLGDADFQMRDAREQAIRGFENVLRSATNLRRAAEIERVARLGPEFYAEGRTMASLDEAIRTAIRNRRDPYDIISDLSALPIPANFTLEETVRVEFRRNRLKILSGGNPDALEMLSEQGLTAEEMATEEFQRAAQEGVDSAIRFRDLRTFLDLAKLTGIDPKSVSWTSVLQGYCGMVRHNELKEAAMLLKECPQLTDDLRIGSQLTEAVIQGSVSLATEENLAGADRLIRFGALSHDDYEKVVRQTVQSHLEHGETAELANVVSQWRVPTSLVRERAAAIVRSYAMALRPATMGTTWAKVKRAQSMARLPRQEFEDAFVEGVVEMTNRVEYGLQTGAGFLEARVGDIKAIRLQLPVEPSAADRIEARASVAFVTRLFQHGRIDMLSYACREFPALDDETMRTAAVDGTRMALRNPKFSLQNVDASNRWLAGRGLRLIAWIDVRDAGRDLVETSLRQFSRNIIFFFGEPLRIPDDELAALIEETRDDVRSEILFSERCDGATEKKFFQLYGFSWKTFPFKDIPLQRLLETEDPELLERVKTDPWNAGLASLRGLQARAANPKYDPWVLELFPLVNRLTREETVLDRDSEKDGRLLVEYVTAFGMFDLPRISRIFFRLKREKFASLPEDDRAALIDLVGPKATRLESPHLIHELRKLRFDFQRELLEDKVPRKIGTTLGEEAFAAICGTSEWTSDDRPSELFATWKETVATATAKAVGLEQEAILAIAAEDERTAEECYAQAGTERERVAVAPGYEESTFAVPRTYRGKDGATSAEEEIERLIKEAPGYALAELQEAGEIAMFAMRCPEWLAMSDETRGHVNRVPIDELRMRLDDAGQYAPGVSVPTEQETESFFRPGGSDLLIAQMESIAAKDEDSSLDRYLLALSAAHVANVATEAWTRRLAKGHFDDTEDELRERAAFLSQYLREHYLNPAQDPEHTGHAAFSAKLLRALERAWHAGGNAITNPILRANAGIDAVRAKQTRLSTDTVDVTLVPVRGPLSIYAGDIGSACYSSQHAAMARGEYPSVRPMVFVTNRDRAAERLAGSVLFVETRLAPSTSSGSSTSGEKVLVIRANNPRENLVAQLDAPSLVRQTVDAAIATAKRRNIKHVAIVRDRATAASSNRESVSAFYQKEWAASSPVALVDEPETNFNGYDIWNKTGDHPSVIVWTNEDPEAT